MGTLRREERGQTEDFLGCTVFEYKRFVITLQNTPLEEEMPLTAGAEHTGSACLRLDS